MKRELTTAVIGAGPAGLLFCAAARILWAKGGHEAAAWELCLFDKRELYERSHRLRIEPAPYYELQRDLAHPGFDGLMGYLEAEGWKPPVNVLEQHLQELVTSLGVGKELLCVGSGPGETSLPALRDQLQASGRLAPGASLSLVAADSVRSATRALLGGDELRSGRSHQGVARLILKGEELPAAVGTVEQFKLSKLLGSILDYRLNVNGYAEVDLFLSPEEHRALASIGATPRAPVVLERERLTSLRAPLFRRTVYYLSDRFTEGALEVSLQSTFELEQSHTEVMTFALPDLHAHAFLVGDAGISLPFFRGMACLGSCVHSLARVHVEVAAGALGLEGGAEVYEREAGEVREREHSVVRARAALIRVAKEFVRMSSLVPFPIQSWLLSVPSEPEGPRELSAAFWLNLVFALAGLGLALAGPALSFALADSSWGALSLLAIPSQVASGVLYHYTSDHLPRSLPLVRTLWRLQVFTILVLGVSVTAFASWRAGRATWIAASFAWWFLGLFFVAGLYLFEALAARWTKRASPDPEARGD